jgi:hypothetical protein
MLFNSLVIYLGSQTVILVFNVMWNSELVRTKLDLVTCRDQCDNHKVGGKKLGMSVPISFLQTSSNSVISQG